MPSAVITTMHYDETVRVLTIVYRGNRSKYRYLDVPPEMWAGFQAAPSKGAYLIEIFETRGFRFEKLGNKGATKLSASLRNDSEGNWNDDKAQETAASQLASNTVEGAQWGSIACCCLLDSLGSYGLDQPGGFIGSDLAKVLAGTDIRQVFSELQA